MLGICYGVQLMAHRPGRRGDAAARREYGPATISITTEDGLFRGIDREQPVWMSHGDSILEPAGRLRATGRRPTRRRTPGWPTANVRIYGIQFHPEVVHTPAGRDILRNFVVGHRRASADVDAGQLHRVDGRGSERVDKHARATGPTGKVICALSGGVDSAVAATLVHRAVGDRLTCIYVDHGLMRKRESELLRADVRAEPGHEPGHGRRARALPGAARGRRGPRAEAQDHRRRVHPRLRGRGGKARPDRLPDPGHALPGRHRVRRRPRRRPPRRSRPTTTSAGCRPTCASS